MSGKAPVSGKPSVSGKARARAAAAAGSTERRRFLQLGAGAAGVAALAGFGGRAAQHARYNVSAARNRVQLPAPQQQQVVPAGADLGRSGIAWQTPNSQFYRVDTALTLPQIDPNTWSLHIHGMVDQELTLTYKDVLRRR